MRSRLEKPIERRLGKMVRKHPEYADAMETVWEMLVRYRIPANRWITDSLFQEEGDRRPGDVDVLFYSELVFQLLQGHLFYTGIKVSCPPSKDSKEGLLNELTLAAVDLPFEVRFVGRNGERQPIFTW